MAELILAAGPGVIERPHETTDERISAASGWIVTVFDNDRNTWQQVIFILMAATQCSFDEAVMETWEVHHLGKSVVHHGNEDECRSVAKVIATIGIRVEVDEA